MESGEIVLGVRNLDVQIAVLMIAAITLAMVRKRRKDDE